MSLSIIQWTWKTAEKSNPALQNDGFRTEAKIFEIYGGKLCLERRNPWYGMEKALWLSRRKVSSW